MAHTCPQAPQLLTSVPILVSQPSLGLLVQCANPATQVGAQTPAAQVTIVVLAVPHATLQPPQWLTLLLISVSQPSLALLVQCANPATQVGTQTPPVQVTIVVLAVPHATLRSE